jgi:zinc protease
MQEKPMASSVDVSYSGDAYDDGRVALTFIPRENVTAEAVLTEIEKVLADFAAAPVNGDDLRKAKQSLIRNAVLARDSVMGPAYAFGMALTAGQDIGDIENWPQHIEAVTAKDIQDAAQLLLKNPAVIGILTPKPGAETPPIRPVPKEEGMLQ